MTVEEFRQNAPAVVGLEINRLTAVLNHMEFGSEAYNEIVAARHELRKVISQIESSTGTRLDPEIASEVDTVILRLSAESRSGNSDIASTLEYSINRLDYLTSKMRRLA